VDRQQKAELHQLTSETLEGLNKEKVFDTFGGKPNMFSNAQGAL
jgi:hypothetical protein